MTLISGDQRVQTIHSIRVSNTKLLGNKVIIPIMSVVKETKPRNNGILLFPDI